MKVALAEARVVDEIFCTKSLKRESVSHAPRAQVHGAPPVLINVFT